MSQELPQLCFSGKPSGLSFPAHFAALLSLAQILFFSCSPDKPAQDPTGITLMEIEEDRPAEVRALLLEESDFSYEIVSNGAIVPSKRAELRFESSGNVAHIYVKNGDRVTKGQKIAELENFKLQNAYNQAQDNVERARLELLDILIGQGYAQVNIEDIPEEVMKIARVKSNFDQSQFNFELAEYNLNISALYAPFSGVVANLFTKEHNTPVSSEPFCTIIDNQAPEVQFQILESELPYIKAGDKVRVSPFAFSGREVWGRITEINPSVDKNGQVRVKASVDNTAGILYDGMNVKVHVQRLLGRQLVIPKTAVVLRTNKKVVFSLKDGKAQWVYVVTDQENSDSYVVTDGLFPGDSIIYEGNINLAHNSPVVVVN